MPVGVGEVSVHFSILGYSSQIKYFGIDDVTLTPGACPTISK